MRLLWTSLTALEDKLAAGQVAANRLYQAMSLLLAITRQFFAAMSPAQALI